MVTTINYTKIMSLSFHNSFSKVFSFEKAQESIKHVVKSDSYGFSSTHLSLQQINAQNIMNIMQLDYYLDWAGRQSVGWHCL